MGKHAFSNDEPILRLHVCKLPDRPKHFCSQVTDRREQPTALT